MTYQPFHISGADRASRWVITVDHAANTVPKEVNDGDLGLNSADMNRHIAYDIGAKGVALGLGELLNAPVISSNFSRLVIDPNRGEIDPTLIMRLYDGTIIPANGDIDDAEEARRINAYYRPYHDAVAGVLALRDDPVVLAIHSFSPQLKGRPPRPWEVAILHADGYDQRNFGPHVIKRLAQETDLTVGDNEPYFGHLPGDSVDRHAVTSGLVNCLIEVRQDLIATEADQEAWAQRLAPVLTEALTTSGL
ncbi:N-formylglutamate amidohydrolase [Cognatishimia activa]|uniref:N-formylglutamate amidohydrolase n=1 Tax=Cognatishimia activa TaxID=1715691 RepID=A0A975ES03_9RHOB|nr:N-formylglutamate amidohydrolase [Cognatishimia activa]QTN36757.1 N-formylglutamate amidohydrolase [Cognatishimia activa]